jgi:hypothetical protein
MARRRFFVCPPSGMGYTHHVGGNQAAGKPTDNTMTAVLNAKIDQANSAVKNEDDMVLVKDFQDGTKAFALGTMVAIFATMDEEDDSEAGEHFRLSDWRKHPTQSLEEIANALHG